MTKKMVIILTQLIETVERYRSPGKTGKQVPQRELKKRDPAHAAGHKNAVSDSKGDESSQKERPEAVLAIKTLNFFESFNRHEFSKPFVSAEAFS